VNADLVGARAQGTLNAMKTALAVAGAAVLLLAGCASGSDAVSLAPSGTDAVADATTAPEPASSSATTAAPSTSAPTSADVPTAFGLHRRQPHKQRL
jgi:hypothetical protein